MVVVARCMYLNLFFLLYYYEPLQDCDMCLCNSLYSGYYGIGLWNKLNEEYVFWTKTYQYLNPRTMSGSTYVYV